MNVTAILWSVLERRSFIPTIISHHEMSGTGVNNRPPLQSDETQIKRRSLKTQLSDASQMLSYIKLYYLTIYSTASLTAKYPSILTNPTIHQSSGQALEGLYKTLHIIFVRQRWYSLIDFLQMSLFLVIIRYCSLAREYQA